MTKQYIEPQVIVAEMQVEQCFAQSKKGPINPWEEMGEVNDDLNF